MALMQAPPAAAAGDSSPSTVLVNTDRGTLIRDARLEQLLAEHRQFGGMSALQMPAGFLRDATHDVDPKR
jgi:sigma-E factor negative regulatory protein RseA